MALSANPLLNATSAHGDISSQKSYQNFNGTASIGTTYTGANAFNYIINNTANATAVTQLLLNFGLSNFGYTAFVVSWNGQDLWATRATVPASGAPSGTTWFTRIGFLGNEELASGDMALP
jgi:hypothetical protein